MNSWNNVSVTDWLNNENFTIRLLGGSESSDASQNYWDVDATLLHIWTETDYNYDYVLRVNNTDTDSWQIRLKKYSDSSIKSFAELHHLFSQRYGWNFKSISHRKRVVHK